MQLLPWTPFASVPQQPQGEFCKLVFVGASPTRGSILRSRRATDGGPSIAWRVADIEPSGLWCNSSISPCEGDGPGATPGFLTNFKYAKVRWHTRAGGWITIRLRFQSHPVSRAARRRSAKPQRWVQLPHGIPISRRDHRCRPGPHRPGCGGSTPPFASRLK